MIDITTTYLGLPMKSPIVASASPLCESLENIRHLEDAGVGAVVLPSLLKSSSMWRATWSIPIFHAGAEFRGIA